MVTGAEVMIAGMWRNHGLRRAKNQANRLIHLGVYREI
jgi:hypothetical protein